jgi:serine/threonine protein kinase
MMNSDAAETVRHLFPAELESRYNVLRAAGRGGMGTVYEAIDRETGDKVALKMLNPEIAQEAAAAERFKTELLLTRKITHRNVCRVHDLYRFDGTAFISMEYVDGESLRDRLNRTAKPLLSDALSIAAQMLDGLEEAHRQNIIHRDLKPENIMITAAGTVKIMDFGLAKDGGADLTTTNAISGTPAYMSPEQALGQGADHRSDIYSFGLILYEMLCGKRAFAGDSAVAVAMKQVNESPIAPRQVVPDLPIALEAVVLRCLEKDRARRFASIAELRGALTAATDARAVNEPPAVPHKAHSTRTVAIVVSIIILIAVIAGWFMFGPKQPTESAPPVAAQPSPAVPAPVAQPGPVAPAQTGGPSIAVLDFSNLQKDAQYASLEGGIAESFTSSFVASKRFRVVERAQLEKIRSELNLNRSELVDPATAQKVGKLIGAQYLMLGSFQVLGGQIRINARLLRVETGEILQTDAVTGAASSALTLPDTLAAKFLSNVK